MAPTVTLAQSLATAVGTGPYTIASFTPPSGAWLGVFVALPDHTNFGQATVTDSLAKLTFVRDDNQPRFDVSNGSLYFFVADRPATAEARTLSVGVGNDAAGGCLASVISVVGPTKFGASSVRSAAIQNNGPSGTPSVTWTSGNPSLAGNVIVGAVANRTNPATMTAPSGFTELLDTGIATATPTGLEAVAHATPAATTTVSWGSSSASNKAVFAVEVDMRQSEAMPTTNPPGWRMIFSDDFTTDFGSWGVCTDFGTGRSPDRLCATLPDEYETKWWAYTTNYDDTRQKLTGDGGHYKPANQSMSNSFLKLVLRRTAGVTESCAPIPKIPTDNGGALVGSQTYGRYAVRWWCEPNPDLKTAWLLFREVDTWGEIDFPEADLSGTISAFNHHDGGGQQEYATATAMAGVWHTAVIEWTPTSIKFYLDDVLVGTETGVTKVPDDLMTWVLQSESRIGGAAMPATIADTTILIDWVAVWAYDPSSLGGGSRAARRRRIP